MARSLSQAESQEQHKQPAIPTYPCGQDMVEGLSDPLAQLALGVAGRFNNNSPHHRWRQGRGNRHWHGGRHGRHRGGEEHEVDEDNYEVRKTLAGNWKKSMLQILIHVLLCFKCSEWCIHCQVGVVDSRFVVQGLL